MGVSLIALTDGEKAGYHSAMFAADQHASCGQSYDGSRMRALAATILSRSKSKYPPSYDTEVGE